MKTITHPSEAESSRLASWLVAAMIVLVLMFAVTVVPWKPYRLAASVIPTHALPLAVPPSSLVKANPSGTSVPDAGTVLAGVESSPEEPAPTF